MKSLRATFVFPFYFRQLETLPIAPGTPPSLGAAGNDLAKPARQHRSFQKIN
jgi:hypothetical protein